MIHRYEGRAVAILFGITLLAGLLRFEGATQGYWDTYITAPAAVLTGHSVDFTLKDGSSAWHPSLSHVLPDDLVDRDGFGIVTKDQRIGGPLLAAPFFAAFGLFGMRLLFGLSVALIIPAGFLAARQALIASAGTTTRASLSALLAATFLAWNPYVLSIDRLNANVLVLAPCLLLIYLLQRRSSSPLVLGLLLGLIAGIRNEAVCFVPAISLWILWADGSRDVPERLGRLVQVGLWTVVAMLPVFYWKWFAFGHPLMHPSQYPHFQGFRPEFVHSLFGIEFRFNGLFNWPLHDDLVRTPHFGYPTYLLFPLVTLRSLGSLACALILIGLVRAPRRLGLFLVLWMLPVFVLFGPQENWEEVKMTFMLLAWPTFVPASALGLAWITSPDPRRRRLLGLVGLAFALLLLGRGLARVEVPADERWYVRFPKASPGDPDAREGLAEADRNDWLYFQSFESAEEIARERAKLRALWPWPARYLPVALPQPDAIPTMRNEMGARDLQILDIWGYIYGTRK